MYHGLNIFFKSELIEMINSLSFLKEIFSRLFFYIEQGAKESEDRMVAFGVFSLIAYFFYYFINLYLLPSEKYENLTPRLIISFLCFLLIFKNYWPDILRRFLPIYWYITVLYTMPFFITFMALKNNFAAAWMMNLLAVLILMMLLVDWISYSILLILGILFAWIAYYFTTTEPFVYTPGTLTYRNLIDTFSISIVMGVVFSRKKAQVENEKLQIMKLLGASVAHELRTPLSSLRYGVESLYRYFPILVKVYRKAGSIALVEEEEELKDSTVLLLEKLPDSMERELKLSSMVIELLLNNIKIGINAKSRECFLITSCIEEALESYPFKEGERELIEWEPKADFKVYGENLSFILVFINLIKNSLYYIAKANKGMIRIQVKNEDDKYHSVYFSDTATGIPAKELPHIFDRFYSNRPHGTGAGLAYCKMVMKSIGGDIFCSSKENEYTEFKLVFPAS